MDYPVTTHFYKTRNLHHGLKNLAYNSLLLRDPVKNLKRIRKCIFDNSLNLQKEIILRTTLYKYKNKYKHNATFKADDFKMLTLYLPFRIQMFFRASIGLRDICPK